jgi:uncharacterized protein
MDFFGFPIETLLLLLSASLVAGFLDTLAGGGGLITVPALMMTGIPPLTVLGTNKLQSTMGTALASVMMIRKKKVRFRSVRGLMLYAFLGSIVGSLAIQFIDPNSLKYFIPAVLLIIAVYFIFSQQIIESNDDQKISYEKYRNFVVPTIGFYDGALGPGTGSFFNLSGVALRGLSIVPSTAIAKTLNFSTNIASLIVFLCLGKVIFFLGGIMMIGQFSGAWVGSHFLFQINPKHLKHLVVVISLSMLVAFFLKL